MGQFAFKGITILFLRVRENEERANDIVGRKSSIKLVSIVMKQIIIRSYLDLPIQLIVGK